MKKFIIFSFFTIMAIISCNKPLSFTQEEVDIINLNDSIPIMKLYTVDNEQDSILLRQVSDSLTQADLSSDIYKKLKERMLATVKDSTNEGVGIAAPQVGISKRLVIVQRLDKAGEPYEFYPNLRIISYSKATELGWEGCLSVPGRREKVCRSQKIEISYTNEEDGSERREKIEGFTAVIFQHEYDHLEGTLYIDRL